MKYKLVFIVELLFWFLNLEAQDLKFCFQTGYGFYNMSSLSVITQQSLEQLPFQAKIISNYPAYHYYQPMIKLSGKNLDFGFTYLFQTTGSRISSKDYSGEYRFDSKINSHSPGIILNGITYNNNLINIGVVFQAGVNFSELKFNEYFQVDTVINNEDYEFTSHSFYIQPGINIIFPLNFISFELNAGYFKEFLRNDFSQRGESQNVLIINKDFAESDMWDGLRFGATISYRIKKVSR